MQYANIDDLTVRVGARRLALFTDLENGDVIDEAQANNALTEASRICDGYLARYELPLSKVPSVLKPYVLDLAVHILAKRDEGFMTDTIREGHKFAIDFLKSVSNGKANLGPDEPRLADDGNVVSSNTVLFDKPEEQLFSRENLKGL
jgi:phage gp36-like protein